MASPSEMRAPAAPTDRSPSHEPSPEPALRSSAGRSRVVNGQRTTSNRSSRNASRWPWMALIAITWRGGRAPIAAFRFRCDQRRDLRFDLGNFGGRG